MTLNKPIIVADASPLIAFARNAAAQLNIKVIGTAGRFQLEDYVDNPVALARIQAKVTQEELADVMNVTQAYISRIEHQDSVSAKVLVKVNAALNALRKK